MYVVEQFVKLSRYPRGGANCFDSIKEKYNIRLQDLIKGLFEATTILLDEIHASV